jgi:F-type H+-transporting ATPase subunit delta
MLCQNRRLQRLNVIFDEFTALTKAAEGIVEGVLETTTELSKNEIETLQKSLKLQLGKDVFLHQEIKESLLGGVVLRIGSMMIDASIGTQLTKLRLAMKG